MTDFAPDDPDFYLRDPWAWFRRLRAEDPLPWYEAGRFWCVLKHADRKLVIQAFTPRRIAAMEPRIREIARESLDAVPRGEPVDFVAKVAVPLPMFVIAEKLGVPRSDWADFRRWSDAMIRAGGGEVDDATRACLAELLRYFQQHVEARRRAPRDDLVSLLAHAEIEGDSLSDPEIGMFCMTLLVAGNETTRNLVSGGARALLRFPEQRRALDEEPGLLPNAVEEMLRWWTPIWSFVRHATRDTELRGRRIRAGDSLVLLYASANRDEEVWGDDAEAFDVRRRHDHRRHQMPVVFRE